VFNFDLNAAMSAQRNSQVLYGLEFRYPDLLSKMFINHPLWNHMKEVLSHGASYPLEPIPQQIREEDLEFHKNRGNQKSALKISEAVTDSIEEDVEKVLT